MGQTIIKGKKAGFLMAGRKAAPCGNPSSINAKDKNQAREIPGHRNRLRARLFDRLAACQMQAHRHIGPMLRTLAAPLLALLLFSPAAAQTQPFAEIESRAATLRQLKAVAVSHNGEIVFEHGRTNSPANIKSASKTIITALVGIAIEKGLLEGPDQKIASVLASDFPENPDPRLYDITIGHLMTMRSGLERTSGANYGSWISSRNWVRDALARPFVDEPGGRMLYSTGNTHLLSAILTKVSGKSTLELANDWLAKPLGFRIASWDRDRQGIYFGGNNMALSPRALIAFGEMFRNGGMAYEQRILGEEWIKAAWTPVTESFFTGHGYGYAWFATEMTGLQVRYAWGHGGQMLYVVPDAGLTVAMVSETTGYQRGSDYVRGLHALMEEAIIPAVIPDKAAAR